MHFFLRGSAQALTLGPILLLLSCGGEDLVAPTTGNIAITTATSGPEPDADGYTISVNDGAEVGIGANGTHQVAELAAGSHTVRLGGMAANCLLEGENPRAVSVEGGATATVQLNVTCGPTTGSVRITASTTGTSPDADGYTVTLDGADRGALGASGELTIEGLAAGDHVVGLSGIAANCQAAGENPRPIAVTAGAAVTAAFVLTCTPPAPVTGGVRIATTTTGNSPDPDGYAFAVDGGATQPVGTSAVATVSGIAAGNHTVTLSGVAGNCTVQGTNPRPVTVTAGATAEVAFAVTCTAATGSLRIRTTTTGDSPDPDGYTASVDGGAAQTIEVNGNRTVSGLNPGSHQVTLAGVASNCTVSGDNPLSATVTAGGTKQVSFAITCSATSGSIEITTATTGGSQDADGYTVAVDGGTSQKIGANEKLTVSSLAPGAHQVMLAGVASNCTVAGNNPRPVTVTAGEMAAVSFSVSCTVPLSSSKIAFNSWDGGTAAIYVVNPDGTGLTKLTPQGQDDRRPAWSPDRSKLAFVRNIFELWVMNSDGHNRVRLTNRLADGNGTFRWSPDGSMIAFETNDEMVECELDGVPSMCSLPQIWTMRSDGSNVRKVADGADPSWAPDGRRIAFAADGEIQVANADGTGRRTLTDQPRGAFRPAWSPAGGRIAFVTLVQRAREVTEILVMKEDGTQVSNLTSGRGADSEPVWSPDGSKIAFNTFDPLPEGANGEVAVMNPDGTGRTVLTNNPASDGAATWSPEGDRLAFMRKSWGQPTALDVYVINVDGTGERNLTNNPEITDDWPSWSSQKSRDL
jgi:Tol biopolymer transport system component